ncbi:MAG: hypothetical protein AAF532_03000 [Planctomycetota bacterium]
MSTVDKDRVKIVLPRSGSDSFWATVHDHYAGEDKLLWKRLAMLALRENAGWPLDRIGDVFGHHKGHVQRSIEKTKADMRDRFKASPEFLDLDGPDTPMPDTPTHEGPRNGPPRDDVRSSDPRRGGRR